MPSQSKSLCLVARTFGWSSKLVPMCRQMDEVKGACLMAREYSVEYHMLVVGDDQS